MKVDNSIKVFCRIRPLNIDGSSRDGKEIYQPLNKELFVTRR